MEQHNGAIFHAAVSILQKLDSVQKNFLDELDVSASTAFLKCNFAPPKLRRNIGVLGLLYKRVLGKIHPIFQRLLTFHKVGFGSLQYGEHHRQLYGHFLDVERQHSLHDRSIFASVYV